MRSVLLSLGKRVGNLFAAVDGADENQKGSSGNDKAEGSRRLVSLIIYADSNISAPRFNHKTGP